MTFPVRAQLRLQALLLLLLVTTGAVSAVLPGSEQQIKQEWLDARQVQAKPESRYLNRLVLSGSAYLRQHADNPIDWYPWSETTLKRAAEENKLIFLSIGYASCHWCHVMEEESFSDIDVASLLNRSFVSIKVDREQQPDIDAYYSMAVEVLKGETGWPITVVLLPDGKPVFAANYISKERLITAMQRLNRLWAEQPSALTENARLLSAEIERRYSPVASSSVSSGKAMAEKAGENLLASVDAVYGGFGLGPKFPDELKLQFLLNQYKAEPTAVLKGILIKQLDANMDSGMSDSVFGGVFRYTTDREMTRPHFEKMLYNQALSVSLYTDAADWLDKPEYESYAGSIISFVENALRLPDGNYAAAVDADFKGEEGGYYLWTDQQLTDLPSETKTTGFDPDLHFIYAAIPVAWKNTLLQYRADSPRIIENRITAWNALWLTALLDADEIELALQSAEAIWKYAWVNGQLHRLHGQPAYLDDYSYLAFAYWQLYKKTANVAWKTKARLLDQAILDKFYRDGNLSYQQQTDKVVFPMDIYRDRELPGSAAIVLRLFGYHQMDTAFVEAYTAIKNTAYSQIGNNPEYYLSLNLATSAVYPAADKIIAKGHAIASLDSVVSTVPGDAHWQLKFSLEPGWHINASEVFDKNLIATKILPNQLISKVSYPQGEVLAAEFTNKMLNVYSGQVSISISAPTNPHSLSLLVKVQACSNDLCLLPETIALRARRYNQP